MDSRIDPLQSLAPLLCFDGEASHPDKPRPAQRAPSLPRQQDSNRASGRSCCIADMRRMEERRDHAESDSHTHFNQSTAVVYHCSTHQLFLHLPLCQFFSSKQLCFHVHALRVSILNFGLYLFLDKYKLLRTNSRRYNCTENTPGLYIARIPFWFDMLAMYICSYEQYCST